MRDRPPPRYRVIERGRRLEVIDDWQGGRPVAPPPPAAAPASPLLPGRGRGRGRSPPVLKTLALFDDKGPRTIALDDIAARQVMAFGIAASVGLALFVALAVVAGGMAALVIAGIGMGAVGQHGRPWLTARLDQLDRRTARRDR